MPWSGALSNTESASRVRGRNGGNSLKRPSIIKNGGGFSGVRERGVGVASAERKKREWENRGISSFIAPQRHPFQWKLVEGLGRTRVEEKMSARRANHSSFLFKDLYNEIIRPKDTKNFPTNEMPLGKKAQKDRSKRNGGGKTQMSSRN